MITAPAHPPDSSSGHGRYAPDASRTAFAPHRRNAPATNLRTDQWGGGLPNRARFLPEIVRQIRARVSPGFAVLVKITASDFQPGGFDIDDSAHLVGLLDSEGIDLVEISGGTYESTSGALGVRPDEPGTSKDAYFAGFAPPWTP